MVNTNIADSPDAQADWELAGKAWVHAAIDRAYRFEPYALDSVERVFDILGVSDGRDLLHMAFATGYVLGRAERLGAATAGIDTSAVLIDIVHRRASYTELGVSSVFELSWQDDSSDIVTSFNGIWGGCQGAVGEDELRRQVLEVAQPRCADDGSYLLVNQLTYLIAGKPATSETVR
jgi:hypothetical protein